MNKISLQVQSTVKAANGKSQTVIMDYADVMKEAEWTTNRLDSPGKLTFTCLESAGAGITEGSSVELSTDGKKLFKGYVFSSERNKDGETSYTAYDQLRYLKANASYTFENMSLGQIIARIADDFGLKVGKLEDTGYVFPCLIKENESCLDIIFEALSETIIETGKIYLFYDAAGRLALTEVKNLFIETLIGERSLVTEYTYKRDIDSDTYNRIKLVKKNEQSGRTDAYIYEDSETVKKWGLLQYYDEISANLNEAQIDEMCKKYLEYYNRVLQTLTLEAIGLPEVRAGSVIPVLLSDIPDLAVARLLLAEKVVHRFEPDVHTMSIEVRNFEHLGGMEIV